MNAPPAGEIGREPAASLLTPPDGISVPEWWCSRPRKEASVELVSTMNGLIVLLYAFGGALAGMLMRATLPAHYFSEEAKGSVNVAAATVSILTVLVITSLLTSAKIAETTRQRSGVLGRPGPARSRHGPLRARGKRGTGPAPALYGPEDRADLATNAQADYG